jgi:cutinase
MMSENGIKDKSCCTDMTVIFARGTGEPGNVGIISGPPMFKALRKKLGADRVTVQGVDYSAGAAVSFSHHLFASIHHTAWKEDLRRLY